MKEKKPTNAQLTKKIERAVLHIDRTKNTREVYFDDKGLRVTDCDDVVIVATNFHRHVYNKVTSSGYSRPALYLMRLLDIVEENLVGITTKDEKGNVRRSFTKLLEVLKAKEDQSEYVIVTYVGWFLFNIFQPLYSIAEDSLSNFRVYFEYLHNIAITSILLDEHKDGMTNLEFVKEYNKKMKEFLKGLEETQIFEALSDEERMKREVEAMNEIDSEESFEQQNEM